MSYLTNPICKFKPLFPLKKGKKKNIVSSSLFRIKGGGYKDFKKYIDPLGNVNHYITKVMDNFVHRLFIDNSIYNDKSIMKKLDKLDLEIVVYDCPNFKEDDDHHKGTFGMFVRYFPLFNFPNNDAKVVFVSDVDFKTMENSCMAMFYRFYESLDNSRDFDYIVDTKYWRLSKNGPYILSSKQVGTGKFDHKLIVDFIKDIEEYKNPLTDYTIHFNDISEKKFIYGADEWFLNHILLPDLMSSDFPYAVRISNRVIDNIAYLTRIKNVDTLNKLPNDWKKALKNFFGYVVPERDFKDLDRAASYVVKKFDDVPRNKERRTKEQTNFIIRIYEYFIHIRETKNVRYFGKQFLDHVLSSKYIGLFNYREIKYYNYDKEDHFFSVKGLDEDSKKYLKSLLK